MSGCVHKDGDVSMVASCGIVLACFCSQVEVVEGSLQCPESGREFPISRGVPNMLLNEDEV